MDEEYINSPIVSYGPVDGLNFAFYRVCPKCGRFVKADIKSQAPEFLRDKYNATCKKCGRVQMPFYDWWIKEN